MRLDATTKTIEVILGEAATTQLPITADYVDTTTSTMALAAISESDTASNSTTAVTAVAAPGAGVSRKVVAFVVYNVDNVAHNVTVRLNNNSTIRILRVNKIQPGETLEYTENLGWRVTDVNGAVKILQGNNVTQTAWACNEFRLTLLSGNACPIADQVDKATIYITPIYNDGTVSGAYGNIALSDSNGNLTVLNSQEQSLTPSLTAGTVYDIWAYNSSGTLTLDLTAWTSTTARATALAWNNGLLTKSGDKTRRYVGTIYANYTNKVSDSGQTAVTNSSGSAAAQGATRGVWNAQNRVRRAVSRTESSSSWIYNLSTPRAANAALATVPNSVACVVGLATADSAHAHVHHMCTNSLGSAVSIQTGVGVNSTSVNSAQTYGSNQNSTSTAVALDGDWVGTLPVGYNTLTWLEWTASASGTTTWFSGNTSYGTGLTAEVFA